MPSPTDRNLTALPSKAVNPPQRDRTAVHRGAPSDARLVERDHDHLALYRTPVHLAHTRSTSAKHRIRHEIRHTAALAGRRPRQSVANGRLRHMLIGYARVSKTDGSQSLDPLGLATAGPLVGTGLTGRKAARTLESLCFAGSAPGPRCSLSCARLWRAWGRASSKHQPTPTPVRTRPRMSSTTRRHTESKVPGRPPSHHSRSV